jgi:phosphoribosylamine--glycine ligase/phosphoribosylformylglycinamidine cyclo-ligase
MSSSYRPPIYPTSDVIVFHGGTIIRENKLVTAGGRVLAVSAYAPTLTKALELAYDGVSKINFDGKTFRRDIAYR